MKRAVSVSVVLTLPLVVTMLSFSEPSVATGGRKASTGGTKSASAPVREGNRSGVVPILMYHRIGPEEKHMVRSYHNFKTDLDRLYRMGFRPVTLEEYATNRMALPRGTSPVVITFDDSHPTQFRMKGDGTVDPDSFVGIWMSFAKKHPDFPVKGTFFILPNGPFGQSQFSNQKLKMLQDWECEIGSHTMSHPNLSKLTNEQVKKELGDSFDYIYKRGFVARSLATPYGIAPQQRSLLENFSWNGRRYGYENIVLAGASPAPSPFSEKFDRARIPRIQAYQGPYGVTYWLNRISNGKVKPYVQP